ncbi:PAS domain-containing protein [Dongia deserti]|uniref:PAS domain-containing protein n=1 Tax=Dongia deserti TaxID=2268030 RepID=UPI0013C4ACD0|nr:PAS domain-containing protein [Dongia deserti]
MAKSKAPDLQLEDDRLRRLLDYWLEKRGARLFPSKAEIDPVEFRYVLGYVTLVDVERDPRRYRFRLDGSILVELSGTDYTGRYLDELPGEEYVAFIKETYDRVVDSGEPYRYRKNGLFDRQHFSEETLILPLGDSPPKVEMLMVAVIPGNLPHREDGKVVI